METIKINNTDVEVACVTVFSDKISVDTKNSVNDTIAYGGEAEIVYNGTSYACNGFVSICKTPIGSSVTWSIDSELERVKEEAATYSSKLDAVRIALQKLLIGIPTISEYIAFVNAVKEAVGYNE